MLEVASGDSEAARKRLDAIAGIAELEVTDDARVLAKILIDKGPIPAKAEIDSFHIAVAAVNGMDYLLTWNCTHIANALIRSQVDTLCREAGYEPPVICTPRELMEG